MLFPQSITCIGLVDSSDSSTQLATLPSSRIALFCSERPIQEIQSLSMSLGHTPNSASELKPQEEFRVYGHVASSVLLCVKQRSWLSSARG
jgi:hypothetical protein